MKFRNNVVKSFSLGCFCGVLITILVIFGIATISVLKDGKKMIPGHLDGLNINITEHPFEGYDWSLDISQQKDCIVRIGKRKGASIADRCQLLDNQGEMLVYMVWNDPEAGPGLILLNDEVAIASLSCGEEGFEHSFTYGPYNLPSEKIYAGDIGYRDLDFDGQFDVKDVFNDDGTIQRASILIDGVWVELFEFNEASSTATVRQKEKMLGYIFRQNIGWCLKDADLQ